VKEIGLDSKFPAVIRLHLTVSKRGGPWGSRIKHGEEVNDIIILWEGWMNRDGGLNNQGI